MDDEDNLLFHASSISHHDALSSSSSPRHPEETVSATISDLPYLPADDALLFYTGGGEQHLSSGVVIEQNWHWVFIVLAYVAAFIGSYAAIRLLEHGLWRSERERQNANSVFTKYPMFSTAFVLGSCTIWSMHFIGMQAVTLQSHHTGNMEINIDTCYDWGETFASLILAITGVWMGLTLASRDIFSGADRVEKLREFLQHDPVVTSKVNRDKASRHIHIVALFYRLHWIAVGSVFVALGALSMHYLGMVAMKGNFQRQWNIGFVAASVVVGVVVAFAGIWILFRPLHWKVEKGWYRYCAASVIALAVCSLHFLGMHSVTYIADVGVAEQPDDNTDTDMITCGAIGGWKPDQLMVLFVAIAVPFIAFYVEHTICNELRTTYHQLLNIRLSGSVLCDGSSAAGSVLSHRGGGACSSLGSSSSKRHRGGGHAIQSTRTRISGINVDEMVNAGNQQEESEESMKDDTLQSWVRRRKDWNLIYTFRKGGGKGKGNKAKAKDDNNQHHNKPPPPPPATEVDVEQGGGGIMVGGRIMVADPPLSRTENSTPEVTTSLSGPSEEEEEEQELLHGGSDDLDDDDDDDDLTLSSGDNAGEEEVEFGGHIEGELAESEETSMELIQAYRQSWLSLSMKTFQQSTPSFKDVLNGLPTTTAPAAEGSSSHHARQQHNRSSHYTPTTTRQLHDRSSHRQHHRLDKSSTSSRRIDKGSSSRRMLDKGSTSSRRRIMDKNSTSSRSRIMGNDSSSKHGADERKRLLNAMFDCSTPSMKHVIDSLPMERVGEDSSSPSLGYEDYDRSGGLNGASIHSFGYDIDRSGGTRDGSGNDKAGGRHRKRRSNKKVILGQFARRKSSIQHVLKDISGTAMGEQSASSADYNKKFDDESSSSSYDDWEERDEEMDKSLQAFGLRTPSLDDLTKALALEISTSAANSHTSDRRRSSMPHRQLGTGLTAQKDHEKKKRQRGSVG